MLVITRGNWEPENKPNRILKVKKPWRLIRRLRLTWANQMPRRHRLRGTFVHRILGDGLFDRRLWKFSRQTVARGVALGLIIGLLPTFYLQVLLSLALGYMFKVNVTAAVLATLVTNPLTTPAIVILQYKLGIWMIGPPQPEELMRYEGVLRNILGHGKPFLVGSIVSALVAGVLGYIFSLICWDVLAKAGKAVIPKGRKAELKTSDKIGGEL